jgi:hypothetical protein
MSQLARSGDQVWEQVLLQDEAVDQEHFLQSRRGKTDTTCPLLFLKSCMHHPAKSLIRPFCITILYHNLLLLINIFHI